MLHQKRPELLRYAAGLSMRGVEVLGKFGLYVVAARTLGGHDAGLFFLCLSWINLVSTAARLGLDRGITRHIAAELAVGRGRAALRDLLAGLGWTTVAGIAVTAALIGLAGPVARHLYAAADLAGPLRLAALALVPWSLAVVTGSALAGLKRGVAAQFVQNALWPSLTLLAILLGPPDLTVLLFALAGSLGFSGLIGLALLVADRHRFVDGAAPAGAADRVVTALPSLWQTARPLYVVELVQVALVTLPVMILGAVADAAAVGAFSVASRISMLILVLIISIGTFAAPVFAELHRQGRADSLRAVNRRIMLVIAAAGVPGAAAMALFPGLLLGLIGGDFGEAATALRIFALGQLINCLLPCQDVLMAMTGDGRRLRRLNLLQLATTLALGAVLIPAFGMTGAAWVTAVTTAQGAIGTSIAARRGGALTPATRLATAG